MAKNDEEGTVAKVKAQEEGLRAIYKNVFIALKAIDRSKYSLERLTRLDSSLAPPEEIAFEKLVAVLKALLGSSSGDRIQIEEFTSERSEQGKSVWQLVNEELKKLGLDYGDLYTFVNEKGWAGKG